MTNMEFWRTTVEAQAERVAELGNWPPYINAVSSLTSRIPEIGRTAPGFDAGIACCLGIIPADKQKLAATLHASYTKEAVEQVRADALKYLKNPQHIDLAGFQDTETCWWLAMCSCCTEDTPASPLRFVDQIERARRLAADPQQRAGAALREYFNMISHFKVDHGYPIGYKDGCIQGAYICGYPFGVHVSQRYGVLFIGTFEESLGLEDFKWSDEKDAQGRSKSGPVFGSKQFVKCASLEEFAQVIQIVWKKFSGDPSGPLSQEMLKERFAKNPVPINVSPVHEAGGQIT